MDPAQITHSQQGRDGPATNIGTGAFSASIKALRAVFSERDTKPPIGWGAVQAFEIEHGITLPEPYRTFVAEIADGCSDGPPHYGLLPLAALPNHSDWSNKHVDRRLDKPFPLTEAWVWEEDPRPLKEIELLLESVYNDGSVVLGDDGCGMYWHLIVTGEHRGHIWGVADVGAEPFGATFGFTTAEAGFAGWALHWASEKEWFDVS